MCLILFMLKGFIYMDKKNISVTSSENDCIGKGIGFERIRRITGYLVGTIDRFNDAKRAEVKDRVKHGMRHEMSNNN